MVELSGISTPRSAGVAHQLEGTPFLVSVEMTPASDLDELDHQTDAQSGELDHQSGLDHGKVDHPTGAITPQGDHRREQQPPCFT
jgi:hypothetical protein